MHEILLPAFNLSSPPKANCFECLDNIAVVLKGPQHAGMPLASPDQSTTGTEVKTGIIQAVQFRVDVNGRAEGMIAEPRAVSVAVDVPSRLKHMVADDRRDRRSIANQALDRSTHLGREPVANRKRIQRRNADD